MRVVGTFSVREVTSLPGCAQVAVLHNAFVLPGHRGKGHGYVEHVKALARLIDLGYDAAICTTRDGNKAQEMILLKAGWTIAGQFKSQYTDHEVTMWFKKL